MGGRLNSTITRRKFLASCTAALSAIGVPGRLRSAERYLSRHTALAYDGDAVLAAGPNLVRSSDNGLSWKTLTAPAPVQVLATHPDRPGRIFAGLENGRLVISANGGATWQSRSGGLPVAPIRAIAVGAGEPDQVYASIEGDGLWKSEDAGDSWSLAMDRPWMAEAEQDLLTLTSVRLATGMGGIWIYAGTPVGLTRVPDCFCRWQEVQPGDAIDALVSGEALQSAAPLPAGEPVRAITCALSNPEILYAALPSGIWKSLDGGVVWSLALPGSASSLAVHPVDHQRLVAFVDGSLKLSRDGAINWTVLSNA